MCPESYDKFMAVTTHNPRLLTSCTGLLPTPLKISLWTEPIGAAMNSDDQPQRGHRCCPEVLLRVSVQHTLPVSVVTVSDLLTFWKPPASPIFLSWHRAHQCPPAPPSLTTGERPLSAQMETLPGNFSVSTISCSLSLSVSLPHALLSLPHARAHTHITTFSMVFKHGHISYFFKASHLHLLKLTPNYFFSHSQPSFPRGSSICSHLCALIP